MPGVVVVVAVVVVVVSVVGAATNKQDVHSTRTYFNRPTSIIFFKIRVVFQSVDRYQIKPI